MGKRQNDDLHKSPTDPKNPTKSSRKTRQTVMQCSICYKEIPIEVASDDDVIVTCRKCDEKFHGSCVGIAPAFYRSMIEGSATGWVCYPCTTGTFEFLEGLNAKYEALANRVETHEKVLQKNCGILQSHESKINALASTSRTVMAVTQEQTSSVELRVNSQLEALKSLVSEHESRLAVHESRLSNTNQFTPNAPLSNDVTYIKDLQRKNNLIIQNVPILENEDSQMLKSTVMKVANACGVDIQATDIISATRLQKNPTRQASSDISNAILAKFTDVHTRTKFFPAT